MRALATPIGRLPHARGTELRQLTAKIHLAPNHLHRLELDLTLHHRDFTRSEATALAEALTATSPEVALALLSAFAPGFRPVDLPALLTALAAFQDALEAEDNRHVPRSWPATKLVRL